MKEIKMTTIFKIMQSGRTYNYNEAVQVNSLYYSNLKDTPSISVASMNFFELDTLLTIEHFSVHKKSKLKSLKKGSAMQLINTGKYDDLYAVRLTDDEEDMLQKLLIEKEALLKVNEEIEQRVGDLLAIQKTHENNMTKMKKMFK